MNTVVAEETRMCRMCGGEYPATTEFFYRSPRNRGGLMTSCKVCDREHGKKYRAENADKVRDRHRKYRHAHKELYREAAKRYRKRHPDWWKTPANVASRKRHNERWWRDNGAEYMRRWRAKNQESVRASKAKRRAAGNPTARDIEVLYEYQDGRCFYCLNWVGDDYHVDHYIPVALGGKSEFTNLVIACPSCNQHKSDIHPSEFLEGTNLYYQLNVSEGAGQPAPEATH